MTCMRKEYTMPLRRLWMSLPLLVGLGLGLVQAQTTTPAGAQVPSVAFVFFPLAPAGTMSSLSRLQAFLRQQGARVLLEPKTYGYLMTMLPGNHQVSATTVELSPGETEMMVICTEDSQETARVFCDGLKRQYIDQR